MPLELSSRTPQPCKGLLTLDMVEGLRNDLLPYLSQICKFDYPYIDCLNYEIDFSNLSKPELIRLARITRDLQGCIEQLSNIVEGIALNLSINLKKYK